MECKDCEITMEEIGVVSVGESDCSCCDRNTYLYQCPQCKRVALR
jgi:hypothetical protein